MTVSRSYNPIRDFTAVISFLRELYQKTKSLQNWLPIRFENSHDSIEKHIMVWYKDQDFDLIIGLVVPDGISHYYLHSRPNAEDIEDEMIKWVEDHVRQEGLNIARIHSIGENHERENRLKDHGFIFEHRYSWIRVRPLDEPIPPTSLPENYYIEPVTSQDFDDLAASVRIVFGHDFFTADILREITAKSFYQPDLDLIVRAPDNTIAGFLTFRLDPVTNIVELEPMATLPKHRKLGLGKALLAEGLSRLQNYHPSLIHIGGAADTPGANRLYESMGFVVKYADNAWIKNI